MEADWAVALAADDPVVVVPWESADIATSYVDLRQNSKLIQAIDEAKDNQPLRDVLLLLNSAVSPVWTAKCDVWASDEGCDPYEMDAEPGQTAFVAASYIDFLHRDESLGASFPLQEEWVRALTRRLRALACRCCRVDLVLRRAQVDDRPGFAVSWFVQGCGPTRDSAKLSWSAALRLSLETILNAAQTRQRRLL